MTDRAVNTAERDFDVLIIGGGPAGLSAAIWCADLNLRALVIDEGEQPGGQLGWTFNDIRNYPGIGSIRATYLRDRIVGQAAATQTAIVRSRVVRANLVERRVLLEDRRSFAGDAVIIATGIRRRRLGFEQESRLLGRGILQSGVGSRAEVAGRRVVIVGGGDAALENAAILSQTAEQITLVHRTATFRARREFVDAVTGKRNIRLRLSEHVTSIIGDERFEAVELSGAETNETSRVDADLLLIRIGTQPNTELFAGQVDLDSDGFIRVTADMSTSIRKVYAIGDVAFSHAPTLSTAVGTASIAAKTIAASLLR